MSIKERIQVTKLDAARRQLETAIQLYFHHGDPVSIHTLTAASYNVLRDLGKTSGRPPLFVKETMLSLIKPEHQKELREKLNAAENFFKHADRDPEASHSFAPGVTEIMLYEASYAYFTLSQHRLPLLSLFTAWFIMNRRETFIAQPELAPFLDEDLLQGTSLSSREGFFAAILPLAVRVSVSGDEGAKSVS